MGLKIKIKAPKITMKSPKVTLSDKDRAMLAGASLGPAGMAAGYIYGDKLGKWSQGMWEDLTGKTAREAGKRAAKDAEVARREAIVRQFGEKQQADGMSITGLMRNNNGGGSIGAGNAGFIGSGGGSSGTF